MSKYATNVTVDENTGEKKLIKRLNKKRIDRSTLSKPPGGWNKSGSKARENKKWNKKTKEERRKKNGNSNKD